MARRNHVAPRNNGIDLFGGIVGGSALFLSVLLYSASTNESDADDAARKYSQAVACLALSVNYLTGTLSEKRSTATRFIGTAGAMLMPFAHDRAARNVLGLVNAVAAGASFAYSCGG